MIWAAYWSPERYKASQVILVWRYVQVCMVCCFIAYWLKTVYFSWCRVRRLFLLVDSSIIQQYMKLQGMFLSMIRIFICWQTFSAFWTTWRYFPSFWDTNSTILSTILRVIRVSGSTGAATSAQDIFRIFKQAEIYICPTLWGITRLSRLLPMSMSTSFQGLLLSDITVVDKTRCNRRKNYFTSMSILAKIKHFSVRNVRIV